MAVIPPLPGPFAFSEQDARDSYNNYRPGPMMYESIPNDGLPVTDYLTQKSPWTCKKEGDYPSGHLGMEYQSPYGIFCSDKVKSDKECDKWKNKCRKKNSKWTNTKQCLVDNYDPYEYCIYGKDRSNITPISL